MDRALFHKRLLEIIEKRGIGDNAQPEVKKAIERWKTLSDEEKDKIPLLYWLLGSGTPPYKMSREASKYIDNSQVKGQKCGNCQFAYQNNSNGNYICSKISGDITLEAWCKLWVEGKNTEFDGKN